LRLLCQMLAGGATTAALLDGAAWWRCSMARSHRARTRRTS